ncbi:MAG: hypothetical protein KAH03_06500 [Cocleimonas sp.]|nr:hypothetical protein [Cocleimonas sp.]
MPYIIFIEQLGTSLPVNEQSRLVQTVSGSTSSIHSENTEELMAEPIFCNDNIKIGNTTIFYKSWMDNGIYTALEIQCVQMETVCPLNSLKKDAE